MIKIKTVDYEELPEEIKKLHLPNNGRGKEMAAYLLIYHDDKLMYCFSDAMEPEDAIFTRDLSWIKDVILDVYNVGISDEIIRRSS